LWQGKGGLLLGIVLISFSLCNESAVVTALAVFHMEVNLLKG
jgi:hypothetical protein